MSYRIQPSERFGTELSKLFKKRRLEKDLVFVKLTKLSENPFDPSLNTHKVISKVRGRAYSSRINSDLRIIWDFDKSDSKIIWLYDIGGHSGSSSVY